MKVILHCVDVRNLSCYFERKLTMAIFMNTQEAVKYFKSKIRLAEKLGISHSAVSQWGVLMPEKQALKLDRITSGELKYDWKLYAAPGKPGQEKTEAA
jgi:hypothetical protein